MKSKRVTKSFQLIPTHPVPPHSQPHSLDAASNIISNNRLLLRTVRWSWNLCRRNAEQLTHLGVIDRPESERFAIPVGLALSFAGVDGGDAGLRNRLVGCVGARLGTACVCGGGCLLLNLLRLVLVLSLLGLLGGCGSRRGLFRVGGRVRDFRWFGLLVGLRVVVGGSSLLNGRLSLCISRFFLCILGARLLLIVVLRFASWVAGSGHHARNSGAGLVVYDEVGAGLFGDGRRWDGKEVAFDGVVN